MADDPNFPVPPPRERIPPSVARAYFQRIRSAGDLAELDQLTREIWRRYREDRLAGLEAAVLRRRRMLSGAPRPQGRWRIQRRPSNAGTVLRNERLVAGGES
jgi:hypothetical protein